MTPKEKARELVVKFQKQIFFDVTDERLDINEAKGLSIIAVDEIIKYCHAEHIEYWQEVKIEIERL